eukprot:RCo053093
MDGRSALDKVLVEVAIMKKLDHPNVVKLFQLIDDPSKNKMYLVLEYVENGPIFNTKGQKEGLPVPRLRKYTFEIARGLHYLHEHHIVHRDIKPENILLSKDDVVKLTDFGVSQSWGEHGDQVTAGEGTPAFWSPEACEGGVISGRATDVWALGVTLYLMTFAELPFTGETVQDISQTIMRSSVVVPEENCPDPLLRDLLLQLLEKDPELRITILGVLSHPFLEPELHGVPLAEVLQ